MQVALFFISSSTDIIPFIISIWKYKSLSKELKWLIYFFGINTIFVIILMSLTLMYYFLIYPSLFINYYWKVINSYPPIQFTLLVMVLREWVKKWQPTAINTEIKERKIIVVSEKIFLVSIPIFLIFWVYNMLFIKNTSFDSHGTLVSGLLLIVFSLYVLTGNIIYNLELPFKKPYFWVCSAILIYFAPNTINFIINAQPVYWLVINIVNIFANILYTIGIYVASLPDPVEEARKETEQVFNN